MDYRQRRDTNSRKKYRKGAFMFTYINLERPVGPAGHDNNNNTDNMENVYIAPNIACRKITLGR